GVFDLKTRAVSAIRYDLSHVESNNNQTGYEIDKVYGEFESLEREYFELIRSALLKYSLQARIGKMDGIFVAYHNISKMFGFQYLPLDELDYIIHSSYNSKFDSLLKEKNDITKGIYGEEDYILRYDRDDRKIACLVANREFKMSMNLFSNILKHVEQLLNSSNTKWEKCKIMLKTEVEEKRSKSGRFFNEPVLNIVALPLSPEYEDKSLLVKDTSNEQLTEELLNLRSYNENLLEEHLNSLVGFKVNVKHFYHHHPNTTHLPDFALKKNDILDTESRKYISDMMKRDWYKDIPSTQTPNFFHASDVSTWEVNSTFTDINDKQILRKLYFKYLDVKLNALKNQVITRQEPDMSKKDEIMNRIKSLQARNDHRDNGSNKRYSNFGPTRLQTKLRAYAKKGALRRKLLERSNKFHI
ncbi:YOR017Wp-like protein, partial [Saccharomyces cerevisiae AWRI1631]